MTALSSSELAAIRTAISGLLPDTCNLLTLTRTSDGQGGWTETWGTATGGTAIACRLDQVPFHTREQLSGAALSSFHAYILTLPHGTTVTPQYRAEVNGQTFSVVSVDLGKSWSASVRCIVERI